LQILYLDSLDIDPKLVDQSEAVRAAAWTDPLISKVCSMDRISDNAFGKLSVKKKQVVPASFFVMKLMHITK
jgi:hypothetical protein